MITAAIGNSFSIHKGGLVYVFVRGDQNVVSGGALTGAAYVFQRQGTIWTLQQKLIPDLGGAFDDVGAVYIYEALP